MFAFQEIVDSVWWKNLSSQDCEKLGFSISQQLKATAWVIYSTRSEVEVTVAGVPFLWAPGRVYFCWFVA